MRALKSLAYALAIFVSGICCVDAQPNVYYGGFEGRWEGAMSHVSLPAFDNPTVHTYIDSGVALSISGNAAKVYFKSSPDSSWSEIKPGSFQVLTHKTNAIAVSMTSSSDVNDTTGSGGWVETWTFTLTHKDRDGLYFVATRAVNNYLKAPDPVGALQNARYFRIYSGELSKVPTPE